MRSTTIFIIIIRIFLVLRAAATGFIVVPSVVHCSKDHRPWIRSSSSSPSTSIYSNRSRDNPKRQQETYQFRSRKHKKNNDDSLSSNPNRFDPIKQFVYGSLDGVTHLARHKQEQPSYRIVDGYSDLRLQQQQQQTSSSSWRRWIVSKLLFRGAATNKDKHRNERNKQMSTSFPTSIPSTTTSASTPTTTTTTPLLDQFKGTVYGMTDVMEQGMHVLFPNKKQPAIGNTMVKSRIIPPVIQPRPSIATPTTTQMGPDTASSPSFEEWKESIYTVSDSIVTTGQKIQQFPKQIQLTTQRTKRLIERIQTIMQNTMVTIRELPTTIQTTRMEIMETTNRWITIVQNAPDQIQRQVIDTVQQIRSIPQTIVAKWEHANTSVRIWLRLESPPPRPPMQEPPTNAFETATSQMTTSASSNTPFRDLTWALLQIAGRGLWWSITQLPILTITSMKQLQTAIQQQNHQKKQRNEQQLLQQQQQQQRREETVRAITEPSRFTMTTAVDTSKDNVDNDSLMKEVTKALALAEVALREADKPVSLTNQMDLDISEIQKATVQVLLSKSSEQEPQNPSEEEKESTKKVQRNDDDITVNNKAETKISSKDDATDDLLAEITDALALAEEALQEADRPIPKVSEDVIAQTQKAAVESLLSMKQPQENSKAKNHIGETPPQSLTPAQENNDVAPKKLEFREVENTAAAFNDEPVDAVPIATESPRAQSPSLLDMINRAKATSFSDQKVVLTGQTASRRTPAPTKNLATIDAFATESTQITEKPLTRTNNDAIKQQDIISVPEPASSSVSKVMTNPVEATIFYRKNGLTWTMFQVAAVLYSAVARFSFRFLRLLFWTKKFIKEIPKTTVSDKVCIITGSNTGIGFETAVSLVERGYEVVMACRSKENALEAIDRLKKRVKSSAPGRAVFLGTLDLSSFQSIREFSDMIAQKYSKVDLLVNNAGRNTSGKSEMGLDLCFQTNYLSHFFLTKNLMPLLLKSNDPRVVNLSSVMHHFCKAKSHDTSYWKRFAFFDQARESSYSPSKLAMVYMTIALNRYYGSKGLRSIAVNPGAVNSDIWREKPRFWRSIFRWLYLTNKQGCYTSVAASVADLSESEWYLQPYWQLSTKSTPWPVTEMLGPFVGYQPVQPRLPKDGGIFSSNALWKLSDDLVSKSTTANTPVSS